MPLNFRGIFPPGRRVNVNFDWIDVAAVTGYILYDGCGADLATDTFHLTPSNDAAELFGLATLGGTIQQWQSTLRNAQTPAEKVIDIDFDTTPLQLPRTIEGQAIVKCGIHLYEIEAGSSNSCYVIIRIRKWDGSSETEIASVTSSTQTQIDTIEYAFTLPIDVPRTLIKKGEQIRVTIEGWFTNDVDYYFTLGMNPQDTATIRLSAGNSRMVAAIPFKMGFL